MRETHAHESYRPERDERADDRFRPGETRSWDEGRRPVLRDLEPTTEDFRSAVLEGLSRPRKTLPYRFLYDDRGSALFDRITELEEYYPTRTEIALLKAHAADIARRLGPGVQLVELGSGSSAKVGVLLDALRDPAAYVPIDISCGHLSAAAGRIQATYPDLEVAPICADFGQAFDLPPSRGGRRVGFYPGSTIGNLNPAEAEDFLRLWARRLGRGAALLIGVDLKKDRRVLRAAYRDVQGVTEAFIGNLLVRANRELDADFDPARLRYEVSYDDDTGRVGMGFVVLEDHTVRVGGRAFELKEGEYIHVEESWKYTLEGFRDLARRAGFAPLKTWTDPGDLFSFHLLEARP